MRGDLSPFTSHHVTVSSPYSFFSNAELPLSFSSTADISSSPSTAIGQHSLHLCFSISLNSKLGESPNQQLLSHFSTPQINNPISNSRHSSLFRRHHHAFTTDITAVSSPPPSPCAAVAVTTLSVISATALLLSKYRRRRRCRVSRCCSRSRQPLSAVQPSSRSCRSLPAPLRRVAVRYPAAAVDISESPPPLLCRGRFNRLSRRRSAPLLDRCRPAAAVDQTCCSAGTAFRCVQPPTPPFTAPNRCLPFCSPMRGLISVRRPAAPPLLRQYS